MLGPKTADWVAQTAKVNLLSFRGWKVEVLAGVISNAALFLVCRLPPSCCRPFLGVCVCRLAGAFSHEHTSLIKSGASPVTPFNLKCILKGPSINAVTLGVGVLVYELLGDPDIQPQRLPDWSSWLAQRSLAALPFRGLSQS